MALTMALVSSSKSSILMLLLAFFTSPRKLSEEIRLQKEEKSYSMKELQFQPKRKTLTLRDLAES